MEFDFLTSNPAFNIAEKNNVAGTGGNTTLYRTATRHDFDQLLAPGGILMNITLKGIIPDLIDGYFRQWQVLDINLMDDIDVWEYNTCYFFIEKKERYSQSRLSGGLATKMYSPFQHECFPMVYYSGSNNGMKGFDSSYPHKVIRKLPGKNNQTFIYDQTNAVVPMGPKFAFNVLESKKSYSVTDEPIRGGTICYVPTKTLDQAEKLKLFVEHNEVFKKYVKATKQKYHAFALRNLKRFDLDQIKTGREVPVEWNITEKELQDTIPMHNENNNLHDKIKSFGEVFTPSALVGKTLDDLEKIRPDVFSNPTYTFCDSMCGNGRFLKEILKRKILHGIDKETALKSIYGVDIDQNNVEECKKYLTNGDTLLETIVEKNIRCADALTFNYEFDET